MLTVAKVRTYESFKGDIDGWSRTRGDKSGITGDDWSVIDQLIQSLYLIDTGKASPDFRDSVEQRLQAVTEDERTRDELRRLAKAM